jgi:hypothetical protein
LLLAPKCEETSENEYVEENDTEELVQLEDFEEG